MTQLNPRASLVNLYSSEVICNSTEGSTLADFLYTRTLNCVEKSDKFRAKEWRASVTLHLSGTVYLYPLAFKQCWVFNLLIACIP